MYDDIQNDLAETDSDTSSSDSDTNSSMSDVGSPSGLPKVLFTQVQCAIIGIGCD